MVWHFHVYYMVIPNLKAKPKPRATPLPPSSRTAKILINVLLLTFVRMTSTTQTQATVIIHYSATTNGEGCVLCLSVSQSVFYIVSPVTKRPGRHLVILQKENYYGLLCLANRRHFGAQIDISVWRWLRWCAMVPESAAESQVYKEKHLCSKQNENENKRK